MTLIVSFSEPFYANVPKDRQNHKTYLCQQYFNYREIKQRKKGQGTSDVI
jgi:hypothetical protein